MSLDIQNGESRSSIRQKLNTRVFDLTGNNVVTGNTTFEGDLTAQSINAPIIQAEEIYGNAKLNGSKILTLNTPLSNESIFKISPSVKGIEFSRLRIYTDGKQVDIVPNDYVDLDDVYARVDSGKTYYVEYWLGGFSWSWRRDNIFAKYGGFHDITVDISGDRAEMKSGYIPSENRFYLYVKSSLNWTPFAGLENVDVFLVGGGSDGFNITHRGGNSGQTKVYKASSDGYKTGGAIAVSSSSSIPIIVGGRSGDTSFGTYVAKGGSSSGGGIGGSSGGAPGYPGSSNGDLQGYTTREFGESTGKLYAAGGSASAISIRTDGIGGAGLYNSLSLSTAGTANTGSGGGGKGTDGSMNPGAGGTGLCVIRWDVI